MGQTPPSGRRIPIIGHVLVAAMAAFLGCDSLTPGGEPESVRVRLDSPDVDEIYLVISRWFIRVPDPECPQQCVDRIELVESDTVTVPLPHTQRYPLDFRLQFYAEAYPIVAEPTTLSMVVHVDDREWYNDARTLQPIGADGEQESLQFIYEYNNLTLR